MITNLDDWRLHNFKPLRHPRNKEFVTGRVNIINKRRVVRISIGLIICELIEFNKGERINILTNKSDRNLILIKKSISPHDGYQLNWNGNKNNFMTFDFRYDFAEPFRLSQTIILDYEINNEKLLLVNFEKLKWSN